MTGETLRVGDDQFVGSRPERVAQRLDFGLSRAASGRRVCFVGEKHGVWRHFVAVKTPPTFHVGDEIVHHLANVLNIESRAVIGRVGRG